MEDIWDGDILWKVPGPDGKAFFPGPQDEIRLAFSFSVDSFNPFHMKEAKQSVSSTGIWLVCLNLPPHLRFLPENMYFVGALPGPNKPSIDQMNHSIHSLAAILHVFWAPGVWYSSTASKADQLVKAAVIPIVADMLAARQAGGFGASTSRLFCTCCGLEIKDIENLDKHTWPKRNRDEHIQHALEWRDAPSPKAQEDLFNSYGVRWSALLELPYWDPI